MLTWIIVLVCLGVVVIGWFILRQKNPIKSGQLAPDFALVDQHGELRTLKEFEGNWLVLYFYPKDDTPGCTKQACSFRDDLKDISDLGAQVVGVSVDGMQSHADFARKYHLPFPLLADDHTQTTAKYYSLINLGIVKFARRNTFLIDPQGKIAKVYLSASASRNAADVVADLRRLQVA